MEIELTQGYFSEIDSIDADVAQMRWCAAVRRRGIYAVRTNRLDDRRVSTSLHRLILSRVLGRPLEPGEEVDHIDGNGLNNRRSNLRLSTHRQNMQNRGVASNNASGLKGVYFDKAHRKWRAEIKTPSRKILLGYFATSHAAHEAYIRASREFFGEFAPGFNRLQKQEALPAGSQTGR